MQNVIVLVVFGILGGFFEKVVAAPRLDYDYSLDEVLDSLDGRTASSNTDDEPMSGMDVAQVHLKNGHDLSNYDGKIVRKNSNLPAYFLIETVKQRDKRYTSYLTLCHFKICNMGRKRAARYLQMIRGFDDNDP